ncbi:TetR/AcrR family transcriptional regulator [Actinoplanes sp. LDG1-06]|uniref:TetR/AcrR family transcriptional regulator n=1 Tax=Paractinoplanes ovalisporus TaxID=2810368 RepID=A0ABS2A735_9ACTN|nr:TetR/AcrR family transcriptional regulator [Actinoplanes ovalisporus]MBM2615652.1 TetR/AcrR family transcriptional regulator [Actinoplanes ovalisporus]
MAAGEQRRTEIVAAAQQAIARQGFEGLRVRDVAALVGINIATLHYHFPTKEALVTGVVQGIVGALDGVLPSGPERDPATVLAEHLTHILTRFEADRDEFVVLNELYARAGRDPELHVTLLANDVAWADWLRAVFEAGRAREQFRADLDPDAAAALVIGFLKSLLVQLDMTPQRSRAAADEILRAVKA